MKKTTTRREVLAALLATSASEFARGAFAQGMTVHKAEAEVRGKHSSLLFHSTFVDVAALARLHLPTTYGGVDHKEFILETIGCGCAFVDYDNDGWLDIFVLSGSRLADPPEEATNRLYKNNRDGTFTDVTIKAGLEHRGWACGLCVGDYNNDGYEDLFVTSWGESILYRNNGNGTFTDVTREAGLGSLAGRWNTGATFLETNRNGRLDLFVSNYLVFDPAKAPHPGEKPDCFFAGRLRPPGIAVNCGPRGFSAGLNSLYRNNGNGTFTDVSAASGIAAARSSYGLTAVAADLDDDGWPDIICSLRFIARLALHEPA